MSTQIAAPPRYVRGAVPVRSRPLVVLALVLASCTSAEPPAPPPVATPSDPEPPPAEEVVEAEAPDEDTTEVAIEPNELPWRWKSPGPPGELEYWIPMPRSIRNGGTVFEATAPKRGGVRITRTDDGRERWSVELGERFSDSAALAFVGDAVLVAHYHAIATGTEVVRLDAETGEVEWSHPLQGVGPIGHSKYHNAVQVEALAGVLHVYGREAHGSYVELVDIYEGKTIGHTMVPPELVALSWVPSRRSTRPTPGSFTLDDGNGGQLSIEGEPASIVHRPAEGEGFTLPIPHDRGSCGIADGVVRDDVVYLVYACAFTSGADAYAISLAEGSVMWQQSVYGVGPIAHSAYSNDVRLEWHDGVLLVYGDEAMGDYVEALDPSDGRSLVTKSWPES